jgi:ribosomal protein S19
MRSNWKVSIYSQPSKISNGGIHFDDRSGFLNPYLINSRVGVYNGVKTRLFKIRKEMSTTYLKSFVLCRPKSSHIRLKFSSIKKNISNKKVK